MSSADPAPRGESPRDGTPRGDSPRGENSHGESSSGMEARRIVHVDMDAFYASVEQRDFPEKYAGEPIAVGGKPPRGVVQTASYEARPYGVHSAQPAIEADRKCPDLIFVSPRMDVYKEESRRIRAILREYTDIIEPLSLDEAYLDVTDPKQGPPSGTLIARQIREEIYEDTGLTASAGVGPSKFVAKVASDRDKPDGLTVIGPDEQMEFIAGLTIGDFHGIGPVTEEKMREMGIESGAERTFPDDISDPEEMLLRLEPIAERVAGRLEEAGRKGRTVTLKLKTCDHEVSTRQTTLGRPVRSAENLMRLAERLLGRPHPPSEPVRLLGLSVSSLAGGEGTGHQLSLNLDPVP